MPNSVPLIFRLTPPSPSLLLGYVDEKRPLGGRAASATCRATRRHARYPARRHRRAVSELQGTAISRHLRVLLDELLRQWQAEFPKRRGPELLRACHQCPCRRRYGRLNNQTDRARPRRRASTVIRGALLHPGIQLNDGHQHRQHDQHHHQPHADDEQRLHDGGGGHGAALHFG